MSFRAINPNIMLRGTILAMAKILFGEDLPSLTAYCRKEGVAPSTFHRSAQWLLKLLPEFLQRRRPGPPSEPSEETESDKKRREALEELEDLRSWLQRNRSETERNDCYNPQAKVRIVSLTEKILSEGTLTFTEIARALEINERQLRRIRHQVRQAGGEPPQPQSRRPKNSRPLAKEIQKLIRRIEESADSRSAYTAADIKRILEKNYKEALKKYHGSETISAETVGKYMQGGESEEEPQNEEEHPRGSYHYPQPFQQVVIDTSHFKLFGSTFYFITVFEMAGRLNLLTRVFLRENTKAVVAVLEEFLAKFPGVEVVVIDRGKPYLNGEVKALLEANGRVRLVCPRATPTAKAAAERHFRTLKEAIRPAVERVFPEDPRWPRRNLAKLLEMGVTVFQELYHQIPQEGIDGKSPAERIASFDPVKAAAALVDLLRRARDSEPSEEYAREIHQRFQFPGREKETVKRLKGFRTPILRRAVKDLESQLCPPRNSYIYDPVGYVAAKAHKLSEEDDAERAAENLRKARDKQRREEAERKKEELEREERERREHPERFVDRALKLMVKSLESGLPAAARIMARELRELLEALVRNLGRAFSGEITRLRERVSAFSNRPEVREAAERWLGDLVQGLKRQTACDGN